MKVDKESRERLYAELVAHNGADRQIDKAAEELAEAIQVIMKAKYGEDTIEHLAEELWDTLTLLEQVIWIFDIEPKVKSWMVYKLNRTAKDIGIEK